MTITVAIIIVIALSFDFFNGFHDAANSIATVVSTRVLSPQQAVAWAAFFNFASFLIFGTAVVLILKESSESDAFTSSCLEAGLTDCFPSSNPFTRYAIYAFVGLAEVIALFLISLAAERRMRDRDTAPEWRSWGSGR